jgi:hypothetical protein
VCTAERCQENSQGYAFLRTPGQLINGSRNPKGLSRIPRTPSGVRMLIAYLSRGTQKTHTPG